jgi:hypothetical protein
MLNYGNEKQVERPLGLWDMIGYKGMRWDAKLGLRGNPEAAKQRWRLMKLLSGVLAKQMPKLKDEHILLQDTERILQELLAVLWKKDECTINGWICHHSVTISHHLSGRCEFIII